MFNSFDRFLLIPQSIGQAETSLTAHQLWNRYKVPLAVFALFGKVRFFGARAQPNQSPT